MHLTQSKFCFADLTNSVLFETQYNIGSVLGSGGFGTVYAGTRKDNAAKVMAQALIACFKVYFF